MTIKEALKTINDTAYTDKQVTEEFARAARSGVPFRWTNEAMREYFKMNREGASFALTRKQRAEVFGVLVEVADYLRNHAAHKRFKAPAHGQDFEGGILARQEAAGVE